MVRGKVIMLNKNDIVRVNGGKNYYTLHLVSHDVAFCYPVGGGFQYRFPLDKIEKASLPTELKVGVATLEGCDIEFNCLCNPFNRWNGWAQPLFTKDVLKLFIEEFGYVLKGHDGNYLMFVHKDEPDYELAVGLTKDGLYAPDGWCFDFEERA